MDTHRFTTTIVVAGKRYQAGDEVTRADIPAGNFDSLTRQGQLVEIPQEETERLAKRAAERELRQGKPLDLVADATAAVETPKPEDGDDPDATAAELKAKAAAAPTATKKK